MEAAALSSPALSAPSLPVGTRFGEFVAVRPLAAGGMAELYLAARRRPDGAPEMVAVKRLLPHLGWDPEFVRMFLDEVRIAAGLDHPNIVRVVDFGMGEGGHYLAMEYLHGRTLRELLRSIGEGGPLPLQFAVGAIMEVAAGLHAAHEHRDETGRAIEVVHRDVSPTNVMITFDGQVKLLDFGIARVTEQTQMTRAGTLKGKVGYMSPEQCRGDPVDRRSDVFGLGILLYELTVGRRLFYAENDYAVIGKVVDGDYVRPCEAVEGYPVALEAVVERALQVEPEDRYPTAAALAQDLGQHAMATGLDLGGAGRAAVLHARFGPEPFPHVNLAVLGGGEQARSWLRWAALAGVGLAIGGAGFVAGGLAQPSEVSPAVGAPQGEAVVGQPAPAQPEVPVAAPAIGAAPAVAAAADDAETPQEEPVVVDESEGELIVVEETEGELADESAADGGASSRRRSRSRRKPKGRTHNDGADPSGDPDALLPPTWREQ